MSSEPQRASRLATSPEYVDKLRAAVRVCLPGQDPIDGIFSLSRSTPLRPGPETILDLLNGPLRTIPFILDEAMDVLLITRVNIDWAMAGLGVEPPLISPPVIGLTREESVHVTFNDGRQIDGLIQLEPPNGIHRASDFLNGPQDFFPLRTRIGVLFVNKARVRDTHVRMLPARN